MVNRIIKSLSSVNWGWLIFLLVVAAAGIAGLFWGIQTIINWLLPILK